MSAPLVQSTGRRKQAVARVRLRPGTGVITANGRPVEEYFPTETHRMIFTEPLKLTETSEVYEVDILSAPGGVVKRTLTATSPSVVYANADILADFGAVPSSLTVAVFQISAVAGRGFPRTVTLEIN